MLADAVEVGKKVAWTFVKSPHLFYNETIHYAETFTWLAALQYAALVKDDTLVSELKKRFELLFNEEKNYLPLKNHVDFNMFGSLPLEFYKQTGEEKYLRLGMPYADTQWELPPDATEEQRSLMERGYTWQTRLWMDDMYMITSVQSQAWKITGKREYIDRAANEMVYYLDNLQRPNGLFYHAPDAPFFWGRANGWMAAGMAELLKNLPGDNANYQRILRGYTLMMESLKNYQGKDGMWKQLIDDSGSWNESSSTGMFIYAMFAGINNKWLFPADYLSTVERAWSALGNYIDVEGKISEVCVGTPTGNNKEHYYQRPRITGDYHGQAPLLWCVNESLATR